MKQSWPISSYCPDICLEGLRKTEKSSGESVLWQRPCEYKLVTLLLHQHALFSPRIYGSVINMSLILLLWFPVYITKHEVILLWDSKQARSPSMCVWMKHC